MTIYTHEETSMFGLVAGEARSGSSTAGLYTVYKAVVALLVFEQRSDSVTLSGLSYFVDDFALSSCTYIYF